MLDVRMHVVHCWNIGPRFDWTCFSLWRSLGDIITKSHQCDKYTINILIPQRPLSTLHCLDSIINAPRGILPPAFGSASVLKVQPRGFFLDRYEFVAGGFISSPALDRKGWGGCFPISGILFHPFLLLLFFIRILSL